jgi:hypothetical protein
MRPPGRAFSIMDDCRRLFAGTEWERRLPLQLLLIISVYSDIHLLFIVIYI